MKTYLQFIAEVRVNDVKNSGELRSDVGKHIKSVGAKKISSFRNTDVYHKTEGGENHFYAVKKDTHRIHKHLITRKIKGNLHAEKTVSGNAHPDKTHQFYHHLITKHNITLTSGKRSNSNIYKSTHSKGAIKVWNNLHKMRGVKVHAYHADTKKASHLDKDEIGLGATHTIRKHKKLDSVELVAHKV